MFKLSTIEMVRLFHEAFDQPVESDPHAVAASLTDGEKALCNLWAGILLKHSKELKGDAERQRQSPKILRLQLLVEEVGELALAMANQDPVECLDALTDIQYVLDGSYLTLGLAHLKEAAFVEVQDSNMSKLDEEGRPVVEPSGRIGKSDLYTPPNLKGVMDEQS